MKTDEKSQSVYAGRKAFSTKEDALATLLPGQHYVFKCPTCQESHGGCRCASPQRSTLYAPCAKCAGVKTVGEGDWSEKVRTNWHPAPGFFSQSAEKIARGLRKNSADMKQAVARLNFYINRAGSNLTPEEKSRLEGAMKLLHQNS